MELKLALYAASKHGFGGRLEQMIEALMPKKSIEVYRSSSALQNRIRQPRDGLEIAVLLCESREELESMISMADLFTDIRIILLFPHKSGIAPGEGHKLYPRFSTQVSDDLELGDVAAVLKKMLNSTSH